MLNKHFHTNTRTRTLLFLQGPPSSFFKKLSRTLEACGNRVLKVNFNCGDSLFWGRGAIAYRGIFSRWPNFLDKILNEESVTDIVLFGDCRSYHRVAIHMAKERNISVHVFEEGYLRPDWITMENGGVNGFSSLPKNPERIIELSQSQLSSTTSDSIGLTFRHRVLNHLVYYTSSFFGRPAYPFYRHHRPWPLIVETLGWIRRFGSIIYNNRQNNLAIENLESSTVNFFLFPLQLDSDFQIRVHSDVENMGKAMQIVISSFSDNADQEDLLVIKAHPLDNGLGDHHQKLRSIARSLGVEKRVLFLEGGSLTQLSRKAKGLVTINSTSGLIALQQNCPVVVLGKAVYDVEGLTHQGSLASFWIAPQQPDEELLACFIKVLKSKALINGSFFTRKGISMAVRGAAQKIEASSFYPQASLSSIPQPVRSQRSDDLKTGSSVMDNIHGAATPP